MNTRHSVRTPDPAPSQPRYQSIVPGAYWFHNTHTDIYELRTNKSPIYTKRGTQITVLGPAWIMLEEDKRPIEEMLRLTEIRYLMGEI